MNPRTMKGLAFLLGVLLLLPAAPGQAASKKYGELMKRLPDSANFLMMVDADALWASPLATREGWLEKAKANAEQGLGLAPEVTRYIVASDLDLKTLDERAKLGMAELRGGAIDIAALAEREGGYVDTIGQTPAAFSPRGIVLLSFPPNILAFVQGADRQSIQRSVEGSMVHPRTFPPGFADRALFRADQGSQVVLAVNLAEAFSARGIEAWLKTQDNIAQQNLDPKLLADRLATAKLAFLQLDIKETIQGTLQIEFDQSVDYAAPVLKQLLLTTLEEHGAMLPDLKTWRPEVSRQKSFIMTGTLKTPSLAMILGLSRPPGLVARARSYGEAPPPAEPAKGAAAPATSPGRIIEKKDVLQASQQYYRAVVDTLESLKSQKGSSTYASLRIWYERAAKQIEEMPILGVDSELLDWGTKVARTLREMAFGINYSAKNQTYTLANSPNGYGGYYYGGYGYGYGGSSKSYDQATIKRQSDAVLSTDLDARWQVLETTISDMRRKMTEKYQVEF